MDGLRPRRLIVLIGIMLTGCTSAPSSGPQTLLMTRPSASSGEFIRLIADDRSSRADAADRTSDRRISPWSRLSARLREDRIDDGKNIDEEETQAAKSTRSKEMSSREIAGGSKNAPAPKRFKLPSSNVAKTISEQDGSRVSGVPARKIAGQPATAEKSAGDRRRFFAELDKEDSAEVSALETRRPSNSSAHGGNADTKSGRGSPWATPAAGTAPATINPRGTQSSSVTSGSKSPLNPDLQAMIDRELKDASAEDSQYWRDQLERVNPSVIPDILRARRLTMQVADRAATGQLGNRGTSGGRGSNAINPAVNDSSPRVNLAVGRDDGSKNAGWVTPAGANDVSITPGSGFNGSPGSGSINASGVPPRSALRDQAWSTPNFPASDIPEQSSGDHLSAGYSGVPVAGSSRPLNAAPADYQREGSPAANSNWGVNGGGGGFSGTIEPMGGSIVNPRLPTARETTARGVTAQRPVLNSSLSDQRGGLPALGNRSSDSTSVESNGPGVMLQGLEPTGSERFDSPRPRLGGFNEPRGEANVNRNDPASTPAPIAPANTGGLWPARSPAAAPGNPNNSASSTASGNGSNAAGGAANSNHPSSVSASARGVVQNALGALTYRPGSHPPAAPNASGATASNVTTAAATAGAAASSGNWAGDLDRLTSALEQELAQFRAGAATTEQQQEAIRRQVYLRLLYLMSQRQERALTAIPHIEPADQEYWQQMIWALSNYLDYEHLPQPKDRATQSIAQLNQAMRRLRDKADLELRNLAFCREITFYGNYERFPRDEFRRGDRVLLYVEVENFRSETTPDGQYRTLLSSTLEILGSAGESRWKKVFTATEDLCHNQRRDYFHNYQLTIPDTLPLGPHVAKLTVVDELSGKLSSSSINFTVR